MNPRRLLPLAGGLLLIGLGILLLAANLGWLQLEWLWLLRFLFPALFLLIGINKLVRHFTWEQEELARRPMKSSLLGGVFWIFLGSTLAADVAGWTQTLQFLGAYWPLVIILFGAGKIVDFYRFSGRFQVRAAEIFGLIFITVFGVTCNRLSQAHLPLLAWEWPWDWSLPIEPREPRHRFEAEQSFGVEGVSGLRVDNLYGDVRVEAGTAGTVQVQLTAVVRDRDAAAAQSLADRFKLHGTSTDGQLEIGTNRPELGSDGKKLNSHLVVRVPAGLPVQVRNGYGSISVRGLKADCRLENDYGRVSVNDLEGNLVVATTRQRVDIRDVAGTVKVTNSRGPVRLESIDGPVEAETSYEALEAFRIEGDVVATNRLGRLRLERINGRVDVTGGGSELRVSIVQQSVAIREVRVATVSELKSGLRLDTSAGEVEVVRVDGPVEINATQTRVEARDLQAGLSFKGQGTQVAVRRVKGRVRIETTLRDVSVDDFEGPVDVQNEFAKIQLEARSPLAGPVVAANRNGEITVSLPAGAGFELSAQSRGGRVVSEFGDETRRGGELSVVRTTVGGGGPKVELQTTHSRIRIRKRG